MTAMSSKTISSEPMSSEPISSEPISSKPISSKPISSGKPLPSGRHLLITADAVSGVWTYASGLAQEMAKRGWTVTLVTLGPAPRPEQFMPLLAFSEIDLEITDLELEWQDPEGRDRQRALDYLAALEDRLRPHVVHLNGYREACAGWRTPVIVTAHSCVGSWWQACRGTAPAEAGWQPYLADVATGLDAADRWVAPTAAFRDTIEKLYAPQRSGEVIWNGLDAFLTPATALDAKQPFILAAGRLWEEAKNIAQLPAVAQWLNWPVRIAGARRQDEAASTTEFTVEWLGNLAHDETLGLMQKAAIFVSPAIYEPFGMTVLEAAASGCALVLSDIATHRELWDGAALFVDAGDGGALQAALNALSTDAGQRRKLQEAAMQRAARYNLAAKADSYERLYGQILDRPARRRNVATSPALAGAWA